MSTRVGTNGNDPNLNGTGAIDHIFGLAGNDTLRGFGSHDQLFGGSGKDQLFGGTGNDLLKGGLGNDLLNGGDGTDTADYSTATINPPGPIGPILTTGASSGITIGLFGGDGQSTGGGGSDELVSIENLIGSKFNDTLFVSDSFLSGGTIDGAAGQDVIDVVRFNGTVNGGAGNDTMSAGTDASTLNGGDGNDRLTGDDFHGTLNGGAGNDIIEVLAETADSDDVRVNGGIGADFIDVGLGQAGIGTTEVTCDYNAISHSPAGAGRDVITGFDGADGDRIDLSDIPVTGLSYAGGILSINTDTDAVAEMQIQLIGAPSVFPYIIG